MSQRVTNIYIANLTASYDKLSNLCEQGVVAPILQNGSPTRLYVDIPSGDKITQTQSIEYALRKELPVVLKSLDLWLTPQTMLEGQSPSLLGTDASQLSKQGNNHQSRIVVLSPNQSGDISLSVDLDNQRSNILELSATHCKKSLIVQLVHQTDRPRTHFFTRKAFQYFDTIGDIGKLEEIRNKIASLHCLEPTPLAYLALMPESYYKTKQGVERVLLNYVRHNRGVFSLQELHAQVFNKAVEFRRNPEAKYAPSFHHRLDLLKEYLDNPNIELEQKIQLETNFISAVHEDAFRLSHYNKVLFDVVKTSTGLIQVKHDNWCRFASLSMDRSFDNALLESLLPESKAVDKNPMNRINNATMLIGNVSVQKIPVTDVFKRITANDAFKSQIEKEWKSPSNPLISAGVVNVHTTTLDDNTLFNGHFEGIPHIEKERFKQQMVNLMHGEIGAKLSGAQFKLPVLLTEQNGVKHLKRQTGQEGFTHIAKMPMPQYEKITLAEWLGLRILKEAGFNVAKFQMVSYDTNHTDYVESNGSVSTEKSITESQLDVGHIELDDDDFFSSLAQEVNRGIRQKTRETTQTVPFLLSERFDIPYAGGDKLNKKISLDLGALCLKTSEEKYSVSFESVAERLKEVLPGEYLEDVATDIYKQIIGSYLLHNNDLHLKNITLLATENGDGEYSYEVSPIYDVIVTPMVFNYAHASAEIKNALYKQALEIAGTTYPTKSDLVNFAATSLGLSVTKSESIFDDCHQRVTHAVRALTSNLPLEIKQRDKWKDSVELGLAHVERNLKHITQHGTSYGSEQKDRVMENSQPFNFTNLMFSA